MAVCFSPEIMKMNDRVHKKPEKSGLLASLACLLCLLPAIAGAVSDPGLFESEINVPNQLPGVRAEAMQQAIREVMARVAGQHASLDAPVTQELLKNPERFVQQYRYYTLPESDPPQLKFWVRFDGDAIERLLRQQGLAYWGAERPDTLVWLAVEEQGVRYLVSTQDGNEIRAGVEKAARQRGIPVIFPLLDLQDQASARFADLWGGFFERVLAASERYHPQAVLIGRLNRSGSGGWMARWSLQLAGSPTSWSGSSAQLEDLLQAGIQNVADTLASRYAVADAGAAVQLVTIRVVDVNSLTAYARVNQYLSSLASITDFRVEQVAGPEIQYVLQLNGTLLGLTQTMAIGTVLEPLPDGVPGSYRMRQ